MTAKSLEEYRLDKLMSVTAFAASIGIAPGTYYRLLERRPANELTKRKIVKRLGVSVEDIAEFIPESKREENADEHTAG